MRTTKLSLRPSGFAVVIAVIVVTTLNLSAAENNISEWVHPGADGKLVYGTTPAGDRIMDFSSAGYEGGGVALPDVPVKRTVQPDGAADDTALIQSAIDAVAALPLENGFRGAVLLAPGTFTCADTLVIPAGGIVLRGSGADGKDVSTIKMTGGRHVAVATGGESSRHGRQPENEADEAGAAKTFITDSYVPSGTMTFTVADGKNFSAGDTIQIRRPVTAAWVHFLQMDTLTRGGKLQTWIRTGTVIPIERRIAAVSGNKITLDVPLSDSFDARFLNPPGTAVVKMGPPARITQAGIENLHIQSPPQHVNYTQALYNAVRLDGEDCWLRDLQIDEAMNSVSLGGRRITVEHVTVTRKIDAVGAAAPAEFAPNGDQILLDRCAVNADNVWFAATGAEHSGPIVLLNCTFNGNGHIQGHMRWTTGMLVDNCRLPDGGIDFRNRGAMGSGHGWGVAWAVAWNCTAKEFLIQQPPGACNWAIGCTGRIESAARPFDRGPKLPAGIFDSHNRPVAPRSLYLAQLAERLGPQALRNIGYPSDGNFELFNPHVETKSSHAEFKPDEKNAGEP